LANDVQVYAIDFSKGPSRGSAFLRDLALSTGGRYSNEAATILQAVLDDSHASYRLTYRVPDPTPGFHAIQIYPTRNLNLNFRFLRGYQYPAAN